MMKILKILSFSVIVLFFAGRPVLAVNERYWEVQSIDTMKYSRDLAREKLNDPEFENVIERQIVNIKETGATHVAIGTPYDEEFLSFLKLWVSTARKYGLNIWFRGNLSGWEGWFDYPEISPNQHTVHIIDFIKNNPDIFEDGDLFSSCPECENGVVGDPRSEVDVNIFREFIIYEYELTKEVFDVIGKDVTANYYSMNADVAYLVMDEETTKALDGLVTIDHYVKDSASYSSDIQRLVSRSGGKIVIGEFGAPIPDIHGNITENQQADWVRGALTAMVDDSVIGVNYWTYTSSSTGLWYENGKKKEAVGILENFFEPIKVDLTIKNELDRKVKNAKVYVGNKTFTGGDDGVVSILLYDENLDLEIFADSYFLQEIDIKSIENGSVITLVKEKENIFFRLEKFFRNLLV